MDFDKPAVIAQVEAVYERLYASHADRKQACLLWTAAVLKVIAVEMGYKHISLSAGSANFRFLHPDNDDGVKNTHFSYEFEIGPASLWLAQGIFPEMHVWAVIDTEPEKVLENVRFGNLEVIDLTTKFQAEQAKNLCGYDWDKGMELPDYVWCRPDQVPAGIVYNANEQATKIAYMLLKSFHEKHGITWRS